MPIFLVKSVKIYTGKIFLHGYTRGTRDKYEVCSIHEEDAICWYSLLMAASANRLRAMISLSLLVRTCEYGSLGLWAEVLHILYNYLVVFEIFVVITNLKHKDWRRIVWHLQVNCEYMLGCLQVQSVHCTDNDTFSSRTTDLSCNAPLSLSHLVRRILVAFSSSPGHHPHGPGNIIATPLLMVATGLSLPWILFH